MTYELTFVYNASISKYCLLVMGTHPPPFLLY
nr:MAG TPA: hypothetical protein [Caudoviricetes sp.]